ncbi:MAG: response regulator [Candidatus Lokiarchaeota archaeon]|nr:response regulator [Candidatus Lokiarchaeota archaeon]
MTKILLVDDIPENLYLLETIMKANGYEVVTAVNGAEALDMGRKDPPALIITDILMPVMDGFELCRRWKADDLLKHIPFIFYTATYTDLKDEQFALNLGAERFVVKPQQPEVLVKIVQEILDEFKKGSLVPTEKPLLDEFAFLRAHSEVLLRKLEKKMLQLELEANERKRAEQQLRDHADLLDNAHEAIMRVDMDGRIIYWNKGSERLYGWASEEVIGKEIQEIPFKVEPSQLHSALKVVKEKGGWQGEKRHVDRNGKAIIVQSSWKTVIDKAGKPESILIIDTDITEKKKLEAQFLRAQRLESIGTLTSGIAHDLTNMLTPVKLAVENLKLLYPTGKGQDLLDMIERNALRGANLIKRVLSFARGIEEEHKDLSIMDIITELDKLLEDSFPKSIEIRVRIPKGIWTVSGNTTQLHQVFMNVALNARDAMPDGGVLTISAENTRIDANQARMDPDAKEGPYIVITVADTGIGMPDGVKEKLFEPFFTTKEIGKGTGLGLSTSLGIVRGHGGFIIVQSEVGKGTSFKVYLPAIKVPVEAPDEPMLDVLIGHGETILVADADGSTRNMAYSTLKTNGYEIILARNSSEAISRFALNKDRVSVCLVDMMLPIVDGLETIHIIKQINPDVMVIAATHSSENVKLPDPTNKEVMAFLQKPFTAEALLKTIHRALTV